MGRSREYKVELSEGEKAELEWITKRGTPNVREVKRAEALLGLAAGISYAELRQVVGLSRSALQNIGKRYQAGGVERALYDAPRSGHPRQFSGEQRAKITALACSTPSDGQPRWSLRLLADKAVELEIVTTINHETVRSILKKTT